MFIVPCPVWCEARWSFVVKFSLSSSCAAAVRTCGTPAEVLVCALWRGSPSCHVAHWLELSLVTAHRLTCVCLGLIVCNLHFGFLVTILCLLYLFWLKRWDRGAAAKGRTTALRPPAPPPRGASRPAPGRVRQHDERDCARLVRVAPPQRRRLRLPRQAVHQFTQSIHATQLGRRGLLESSCRRSRSRSSSRYRCRSAAAAAAAATAVLAAAVEAGPPRRRAPVRRLRGVNAPTSGRGRS